MPASLLAELANVMEPSSIPFQAGDSALHYVPASLLWAGDDGPTEELTYEGVHPHDRGHTLMAAALAQVRV